MVTRLKICSEFFFILFLDYFEKYWKISTFDLPFPKKLQPKSNVLPKTSLKTEDILFRLEEVHHTQNTQ